MGLFDFLGFGKREKPNLTPAFETPKFDDLPFTRPLSELANKRLRGEGLGFGSEFVDKASNPAIAKLESQFKNKTMPNLSSQASARGLGRSSLVMNQIGEAESEKNRDVADLVSKFYVLNKQQEKNDLTEGIGLSERLQGQALDIGKTKADEARNLRDVTVDRANANNARSDAMRDRTLGAVGAGASSFFGGSAGQGLLKRIGLGGVVTPNADRVGKMSLLGDLDPYDIQALRKLLTPR